MPFMLLEEFEDILTILANEGERLGAPCQIGELLSQDPIHLSLLILCQCRQPPLRRRSEDRRAEFGQKAEPGVSLIDLIGAP